MSPDDLLTTADVAAVSRMAQSTLRGLRHRGEGPAGFRLGGAVRYRRSVVEAWIARCEAAEQVGNVTPMRARRSA